ncbi:MAG: hypothetical protein O3A00_09115 [Planctomycetota bacterium]|nr:hypothetical protein [Planctomycetota bacterium]
MLGLIIIGAGILGIIIATMETDEFPGWDVMIICVLAAVIPAATVNAFLPDEYFLVGLLVGAACAGLVISATFGMSVKRASIATGICLAIQVAIEFAMSAMLN